ncbi:LysR substrate-binding domain-containing protein [Ciceribacter sp. RN22]|uniref:LysR substrate-binding domain-containing protein n=1 Tax=Ciceribacter sp. RN22 TaxID=2954932 RepID=UPI002093EB7B|nr:LysR substrate-binding domain-containing protein [Ciceribacter sp. RN22]MCO6179346.1 LysR substrate-binding domain-containing protein [Ciceribacter sp. RN22]
MGIFPDFLVEPDVRAGKLVHLLPQWSLPEGGIHAVFPVARFRPAKVRIFLDMLIAAERNRSRKSRTSRQ